VTLPVFVTDLDEAAVGGILVLTGAEARHAATVRRIGPGESVSLTDTRGRLAVGTVRSAGRAELDIQILELAQVPEPTPQLTVVQAIPKGDRGELAVQMLTEVGVDHIVPWRAQRSVAQWRGERAVKSLDKWRRTAFESSKQSRRAHFATVAEPLDTKQLLGSLQEADLVVVLHEDAAAPLGLVDPNPAQRIVVIVGPEGGISPEEIEVLGADRCHRLGDTVLRTSTAGVVAASVLLSRTRRWNPES